MRHKSVEWLVHYMARMLFVLFSELVSKQNYFGKLESLKKKRYSTAKKIGAMSYLLFIAVLSNPPSFIIAG